MIQSLDKPRVLIDARMVGPQLHGVARYVSLIAQGLRLLADQKELPYEPVFLLNAKSEAQTLAGFAGVKAQKDFLQIGEIVEIPRILKSERASLYHSPSFSSLIWSPCPWVVTIHDVIHLHFGGVREKIYYRWILRRFARKASKVLTVSNFSRREISRWAGIPEESIQVVYNALDPVLTRAPSESEVQNTLDRYQLKAGEYFFCLSNPKPHKNVRFLVEAYECYRRDRRAQVSYPLVLSFKVAAPNPGVVGLTGLSELETRALLAGARALFFPSLYEGFGLPPIEAVALGVPVVVSSIPPHEEALASVRASGPMWVGPNDLKGWVDAFGKVHEGEGVSVSASDRARLIAGYEVGRLGRDMDRIYRAVLGLKE